MNRAFRLGKRDRTQDDGVDDREDAGAPGDAEGKRQDRRRGEAWASGEEPRTGPRVLSQDVPLLAGCGPGEIDERPKPEAQCLDAAAPRQHVLAFVGEGLFHVPAEFRPDGMTWNIALPDYLSLSDTEGTLAAKL